MRQKLNIFDTKFGQFPVMFVDTDDGKSGHVKWRLWQQTLDIFAVRPGQFPAVFFKDEPDFLMGSRDISRHVCDDKKQIILMRSQDNFDPCLP